MKYAIGVDVGGTKTAYGLFDAEHRLVDRLEHGTLTAGTNEEIVQPIIDGIRSLAAKHGLTPADLAGVGLAFPSFIDFDIGKIIITSNITALKNFYARDHFEKNLGCRVVIDNDSHVAAIAEHRFGAGRGSKHMLYCAVSTGIANGIIINCELFRGSYGAAGETGHMLLTPETGVECGCGNKGCFMSYSSGSMIVRHIQHWISHGEPTTMLEMAGGDPCAINARIVEKAALAGDGMANRAIEQMAQNLGVWTFNLYQAFNINLYVFGGGLVKFGPLLFDKVRAVFDHYNAAAAANPVYFKFAELQQDFGIIGAEQLLFDAQSCPT